MPSGLEVEFGTTIEGNPTRGVAAGIAVGRSTAIRSLTGGEHEVGRSKPCTDVVVVAFTVSLPIEADIVGTSIHGEGAVSVDKREAAVSVAIANTVVIGNVEAHIVGGAIIGVRTDIPFVGLGAVDRFPSVGFGTIGKGADIGV